MGAFTSLHFTSFHFTHHPCMCRDLKKKITLRDERISSLETASTMAASTLRAQTESHITELTTLREQIQVGNVVLM